MNAATRRLVRSRAGFRCEYCLIHEDDEPIGFHIEHIIPRKHGGRDHHSNLAWCCQSCNLGKSSNLSGIVMGRVIRLYHPRKQRWEQHFRWSGPRLVGKSNCGRATIRVLNINAPERIELRRVLIELGLFPPD